MQTSYHVTSWLFVCIAIRKSRTQTIEWYTCISYCVIRVVISPACCRIEMQSKAAAVQKYLFRPVVQEVTNRMINKLTNQEVQMKRMDKLLSESHCIDCHNTLSR